MREIIVGNKAIVNTDIMSILYEIRSQLTNGKLADIKLRGGNISVTCPHHSNGKEKHASCYINLINDDVPYGYYYCFTCGSGKNKKLLDLGDEKVDYNLFANANLEVEWNNYPEKLLKQWSKTKRSKNKDKQKSKPK